MPVCIGMYCVGFTYVLNYTVVTAKRSSEILERRFCGMRLHDVVDKSILAPAYAVPRRMATASCPHRRLFGSQGLKDIQYYIVQYRIDPRGEKLCHGVLSIHTITYQIHANTYQEIPQYIPDTYQ